MPGCRVQPGTNTHAYSGDAVHQLVELRKGEMVVTRAPLATWDKSRLESYTNRGWKVMGPPAAGGGGARAAALPTSHEEFTSGHLIRAALEGRDLGDEEVPLARGGGEVSTLVCVYGTVCDTVCACV